MIAPDYLAFFNFASGGPRSGPQYISDSNIDWGQDVKKLVEALGGFDKLMETLRERLRASLCGLICRVTCSPCTRGST